MRSHLLGSSDWDNVSRTDTHFSLECFIILTIFFCHFYKNVLFSLIPTHNKIRINKTGDLNERNFIIEYSTKTLTDLSSSRNSLTL